VDEPRVEYEQHQHGGGEDRAGGARFAQHHPEQGQTRHGAGAKHRRFRPRQHHEEHDHADPEREP
jgi:hypothetical protein